MAQLLLQPDFNTPEEMRLTIDSMIEQLPTLGQLGIINYTMMGTTHCHSMFLNTMSKLIAVILWNSTNAHVDTQNTNKNPQ